MATETRRLAAIMFTDMVGYSAISQKSEQLAIELLEVHRDLLRSIFGKHAGREVKTIGDAFMVEFASALNAVKCSIEIQKALKDYNTSASPDRKIYLRIGIHVGDVEDKEGDLYGDGVNISSRLEPLAHPGGICISEDVARQVQNKIDIDLKKMEDQDLKNIKLPIDIYQINLYADPNAGPDKVDNNKLAVLPFQNISPDKDSDYFSDGLTEEITMHLSSIKELKVVSRTTSMWYKGVQKNLVSIGKELNARYILEGSVRKHEDNLRITAQLIDVETDSHLWAETYRGNMADIFDIQENVSKKIVEALRLTLTPAEEVALGKRSTTNSEAFDYNLRAREYLYKYTKSNLLTAIDLFQAATDLDARFAAAFAGMGEAYAMLYETHSKKAEWLEKATEASLKAIMYDTASSEAHSALGFVYYNKNSLDEALTSVQNALDLDEDNYFAYWIKGRTYRMMDNDKDAVGQFDKVLELNPDFHSAYGDLQMAYKKLDDQEKLAEVLDRALTFYPKYLLRHPDDARAMSFYASFLLNRKMVEKAKFQMAKAIELSPNDVNMIYNAACFYAELDDKQAAIETLAKAVENGFGNYEYIKHDPDLDIIRNEPAYIELMKDK